MVVYCCEYVIPKIKLYLLYILYRMSSYVRTFIACVERYSLCTGEIETRYIVSFVNS